MKYFLFLLCISCLFFSCDNDDDQKDESENALIGNWNWIETGGGLIGTVSTPENTGDIQRIHFTNDIVSRFRNDSLESALSYTVTFNPSLINGTEAMIINYDTVSTSQSYDISNDTLFLYDECIDCFRHIYTKID